MLRLGLAVVAAMLFAAPAFAATSAREGGVTVWRAASSAAPEAPSLKGGPDSCERTTVILVVENRWPPRRLRTHGFWSGDSLSWQTRLPLTTQGFFADRMAAGL